MTTTSGWLRRSALALVGVLALAVVGAAGPAQQAVASPYKSKLCWTMMQDGQLKVYCIDIQVKWPWDEIFECWMCGLGLDWRHDPVIREDLEGLVGQHVTHGIGLLSDAAFTEDRALRARLRTQALDQFTAAARYGQDARTTLAAAGLADPVNNRFDPSPDPWAVAAGVDIADGLTLLKQAQRDPASAPRLRALATVQFDEAYLELSEQRVIEG